MSSPAITKGTELDLDIQSLAKGGDAVARASDGRVVFVPLGAPGDRVTVRVTEEHRAYLRAEIIKVRTPSLVRQTPPCPVQSRCGGCNWMHLKSEEQLRAKEELVASALRKVLVGNTRLWPLVRAPENEGYRVRARLRVRGGKIGMHEARSHELVQPSSCLTMRPELWDALAFAGARLVDVLGEEGTLSGLCAEDGRVHLAVERGRGAKREEIAMRARGIVGIARHKITGVVEGGHVLFGERVLELADGHIASAAGFAQANFAQNERLRAAIRAALTGQTLRVIVELYAGDGNLTRDLVGLCERGLAVEGEPLAVERLRDNLERLGAKHWKAEAQASALALQNFAAQQKRCDVIVLDPPRAGAKEVIPSIVKIRPARLVYVSCDASTLARDLEELSAAGYLVESVTPYDFMPHTDHVELLALLRLKT